MNDVGEPIDGRYRTIRVLGVSTWARTLLCEDLEANGRHVVVKRLLLERLDRWKQFDLFEREARVLASLRHPGVPEIFEASRTEADGQPSYYLVQEYIDATSLLARIQDGPRLDQTDLRPLTLAILDILDYLHGRQPPVYHRDLKPSNILLRPSGEPVLVDFGAVCDGWREPDEPGSTVVGTYGYMPPEQYMGRVSARSDLYALGATLIHVVTGKMPHEFPFDSGRIEVPETLPTTPDMVRLIRALLEPAPRDRPASVAEARRILRGDPEPKSEPDAAAQPVDVYRRVVASHHAWTWTLTLILAIATLTATLYAIVHRRWTYAAVAGCVAALTAILWWSASRVRQRPAETDDLFRSGAFGFGRVVSVSRASGGVGWDVGYEFQHDGRLWHGRANLPDAEGRNVAVGDRAGVLFDADHPDRCLLCYPPPG